MDKIIEQSIQKVIDELQKDSNKTNIENNILNPIVKYIGEKLYPYIICISTILALFLIILFYILYINQKIYRRQ